MILLTGNAGFIGTYLTELLLKQANLVRGLDIRPRKDMLDGFTQVDGNILNRQTVSECMKECDTIIHLAAEHKDFGVKEEDYFLVNEQGTRVLLEEASKANIKKFIFYSSVAVYGSQSNTSEETIPKPNNPYGASKLAAEKLIADWANEDSSRIAIIIRPTVVFGPNSKANIFRLIRQICDGRFVMVGSGENIKSIAYVRNLVDATLFLKEKCRLGLHVFNYADEPHMQMKDLVKLISLIAGKEQPKFYIPLRLAKVGGLIFDFLGRVTGIDFPITAVRMDKFTQSTHHKAEKIRELGFLPHYTIEDGLKEHIYWYKSGEIAIKKESDSLE